MKSINEMKSTSNISPIKSSINYHNRTPQSSHNTSRINSPFNNNNNNNEVNRSPYHNSISSNTNNNSNNNNNNNNAINTNNAAINPNNNINPSMNMGMSNMGYMGYGMGLGLGGYGMMGYGPFSWIYSLNYFVQSLGMMLNMIGMSSHAIIHLYHAAYEQVNILMDIVKNSEVRRWLQKKSRQSRVLRFIFIITAMAAVSQVSKLAKALYDIYNQHNYRRGNFMNRITY